MTARLRNSLAANPSAVYRAVWDRETLLGVSITTFPRAELGDRVDMDIRVLPSRRRQGIGTALLKVLTTDVTGYQRTTVRVAGLTEDSPATMWTEKLGFSVVHSDVFMSWR